MDCIDGKKPNCVGDNCACPNRCDPDTGAYEDCLETTRGGCACGSGVNKGEACANGPFIGCEPAPSGGCSCEVNSMCKKADGVNCFACTDVDACRSACRSKPNGQCGLTTPIQSLFVAIHSSDRKRGLLDYLWTILILTAIWAVVYLILKPATVQKNERFSRV
jgi:hypothetical protein